MATTPAAPPASAPVAPAASAAPVAPASSTPTPAAPAAPVTTPTTPEASPQSLGDRIASGWEKAKESVNLETGEVAEPEVPAVEPAAEPEIVPEVTDPEVPAAEPEPGEDEFKLNLDDKPAPAPDEFGKSLTPEQKEFFDKNPDLKGQVFGALRRDAENREIRQYIPDLETAKTVTKAAGAWQTIDNHFLDATTSEGAQKFLDHWVKEALIVDEKGQPVIDENGKYQVEPSLPFILDHIAGNKIQILGKQIESSGQFPTQLSPVLEALGKFASLKGDERLQAAVDVLREVMAPSSPAEGEIPDNLKPFVTSLKAKEKDLNDRSEALNRQQREGREAEHYQSIDRAEEAAAKSVQDQLKPLLAKSGLSQKLQTVAMRDIGEKIDTALGHKDADGSWTAGSHPSASLFQSVYDSIIRQAPSEAREKALKRHVLTYTNEVIGPIVSPTLREYAQPQVDQQTDKQNRIDAQKHASSTEPRGTSTGTPAPATKLTDSQVRAKLSEEYAKTHGGETPDRDYLIKEGWEYRKKEAAALAGARR